MSFTSKLEGTADDMLDLIISIIKSARVNPLFHISEIVQNEMDAEATQITVSFKHKGTGKNRKISSITIEGNGFGFLESFERYHKNIANSIKRQYETYKTRTKSGQSRGEFCIGLQGFRAICKEIQIINLTNPSMAPKVENRIMTDDPDFPKMLKNRKLILWADSRKVEIQEEHEFKYHRTEPGVTCILKDVDYPIKPKDLCKYLSENKRTELIGNKKLHIFVKAEKFNEEVRPVHYSGDYFRFEQPHPKEGKGIKYSGLGNVVAKLHFHKPKQGSKVTLNVGGEPVLFDITRLDEINCPPWNSDIVEGTIEYDRLTKVPLRNDVERDLTFWPAFMDMMNELSKKVVKKIKEYERIDQTNRDKELFRKLETILADVKRELEWDSFFDKKSDIPMVGPLNRIAVFPEVVNVPAWTTRKVHVRAYDNENNILLEKNGVEFNWTVSNDLGEIFQKRNGEAIFKAGSTVGTISLEAEVKDKANGNEFSEQIEAVITHPAKRSGTLARVRIEPPFSKLPLGEEKEYKAVAEDEDRYPILKNVEYRWQIIRDETSGATLNVDRGESVILRSGKNLGDIKLQVAAYQNGKIAKDSTLIIVVEKSKKRGRKPRPKNLGLPTPDYFNEPEAFPSHSHLKDDGTVLYIHDLHPDYKNAKKKGEKQRQKYIIQLYAKELAIKECATTGSPYIGEKMLDVLAKIENHWY